MHADNQNQEHTSSYYAATVNEITDYPVLRGSQSADVCVVGAGAGGAVAAGEARNAGARWILVGALWDENFNKMWRTPIRRNPRRYVLRYTATDGVTDVPRFLVFEIVSPDRP